MTERPKRRYVKDLAKKLDFLSLKPAAQKINGCSGVSDLARRCGINVSTFKNLKSKTNADLISPDHEAAIANTCRFRLNWPEWAKGTAKNFEDRYIFEVKPAEAAKPAKRRTDVPLTPRPGQQKVRGRLALLEIEVVRSNSGEQWPIKIALYCRDDNGYGISHGLIDLDCGDAFALRAEASFHLPFEVPGTNATLRLGTGPDHKPSWNVKARNGVLDDVCPTEQFCIVRGLSPGDTITATFSICVKGFPGADECVRGADGKPITPRNKKLFLERIRAAALAQSEADEVVLCSHDVTFDDTYAGLRSVETAEG